MQKFRGFIRDFSSEICLGSLHNPNLRNSQPKNPADKNYSAESINT